MLLQSKVAVITGSATGIGRGIAQLFSQHGAALLLLGDGTLNGRVNRAARSRTSTATAAAAAPADLISARQRDSAPRSDPSINSAAPCWLKVGLFPDRFR